MLASAAMLTLLFALLTLTVDDANSLTAAALGNPDARCLQWSKAYDCPDRMRESLSAISDRELPQEDRMSVIWFGRHYIDSGHDSALHRKGHRRGILSGWCPWHVSGEGMSTVGPHGLMYALNVHRLGVPGNCIPWQALGLSLVSSWTAGLRYLANCSSEPQGRSWCPSKGARRRARKRRGRVPR